MAAMLSSLRKTQARKPSSSPIFFSLMSSKAKKSTPASNSPEKLTRSMFISPDYHKRAAANPTMFVRSKTRQGVEEVPTPASVAETGIIPEGFAVDLLLDPDTVLASLASQGITNTDQLPPGTINEIKEQLSSPDNLRIVPKFIYEEKRRITTATHIANQDGEL